MFHLGGCKWVGPQGGEGLLDFRAGSQGVIWGPSRENMLLDHLGFVSQLERFIVAPTNSRPSCRSTLLTSRKAWEARKSVGGPSLLLSRRVESSGVLGLAGPGNNFSLGAATGTMERSMLMRRIQCTTRGSEHLAGSTLQRS